MSNIKMIGCAGSYVLDSIPFFQRFIMPAFCVNSNKLHGKYN